MMRGLTNRDIAKQLGIRQDGVNEHVAAILAKIGAANRPEAAAIALRRYKEADIMGISQSYISRLEKRIMLRLKKEFIRQTSCA